MGVVLAKAPVGDAVDEELALGGVDPFGGLLDESLGIDAEVAKTAAVEEDREEALAGQVRGILELGQQVR